MRYLLGIALSLAIVVPAVTIAQQPSNGGVFINLSNTVGRGSVGVAVQRSEMYLGSASASIPAQAINPGAKMGVSSFTIRAWKEDDRARVMIGALMLDSRAPKGITETPIATFTIAAGETVEVPQAEEWEAAKLIVNAVRR